MTESTQLDRWVSQFADRDAMADAYADVLRREGRTWKTWPALNLAIMDRWSESGLSYIKQKAWAAA